MIVGASAPAGSEVRNFVTGRRSVSASASRSPCDRCRLAAAEECAEDRMCQTSLDTCDLVVHEFERMTNGPANSVGMERTGGGLMDVRLLGQIEAIDGEPLALGGPTQRRVLAALALRRNEVVSVARLVDAIWPNGEPPNRAEHNVRTYFHRLRSSMNGSTDRIETVARQPPEFSADGSVLTVPVRDRVVLWNYDTDTWADIACECAGRNLTREECKQFGPRTIEYRVTCEQFPIES